MRDARLFLFDEPLSNLDAQLRDEMRTELKRLHRELGKTFMYVTHDQIEAMTLADRIVVLKDGRVEQQGSPLDLFERPQTRFVAGFIGSPQMNFIDAVLARGALTFADGRRLTLPNGCPRPDVDKTVVLGIRPTHIGLSADAAPKPGIVRESIVVDLVQPTGRAASSPSVSAARPSRRRSRRTRPRVRARRCMWTST